MNDGVTPMASARAARPPTASQARLIASMATDDTALLYCMSSIARSASIGDDGAMQNSTKKRAKSPDGKWCANQFAKTIPASRGLDETIANRCDVTKAAISNWRSDGAYRKAHIWILAAISETPVEHWIPPPDKEPDLPAALSPVMDRELLEAWRTLHPDQRKEVVAAAKRMAKENKKVMDHNRQLTAKS